MNNPQKNFFEEGMKFEKIHDYIVAISNYEKAVQLGNSDALNNLGRLYYNGEGVT
jgi:TPR repeat protein